VVHTIKHQHHNLHHDHYHISSEETLAKPLVYAFMRHNK